MYDDWDDDEYVMPQECADACPVPGGCFSCRAGATGYSDDYDAATSTPEVPARDRPSHIVRPAWTKVPDPHTRWADSKYL